MSLDIRWKQRFSNFKKAAMQLTEFIEKEQLNKFEVQGLIQCFEYTFELAWKTMKDYLEGFLTKGTVLVLINERGIVKSMNN
jgi:nucleotidyltransferase substrate binding protein (TIGR01987 family)